MSKVICDVCGTTYPETAAQCPICNSAKSSAEQTAAGSGEAGSGYAYVKGGRFSKKNVRKRNRKGSTAQRRSQPDDEPSNTGLIVVVILLLLAIVAVVIYIGVHFFGSSSTGKNNDSTGNTVSQTQSSSTAQTTENTTPKTPCEAIQLSSKIVEFMDEGETWELIVAVSPVDTTEKVTFASSDEAVATVSTSGVITAVGGGEAVITVTCGEASDTCTVKCSFGDVEPSTQPSEPVVTGEFEFAWNTAYSDKSTGYGDATLSKQGNTWRAYKSSVKVDPTEIEWSSDDESVCTVKDGIVTAIGHGKTLIHASYNGVTYSCIIRCPFSGTAATAPSTEATEPEETTEATEATEGTTAAASCTISHTDVSIAVGESFKLVLKDASGNALEVTWTATGDNVTIDGNSITGASSGTVTVSVTYEDVTYSCIVRVK